jgi:glycosyltransferase involved in cell wall biosynthesis
MFMPQVSVIIPTRNRASYLGGAVRSVLAQSFDDLEIIVVDDCGDDNSERVVTSFRDPRIRYLRHDRQRGGAAARNTGIAHASGEYIAFLDDDDEWYPEKLARQMSVLGASPPEIGGVYTGYFIVDRSSGQIRGQIVPNHRGDLSQALLAENCIGSTSSMLLRRSCLDKVGGFDERLPSFQDYDLWLRLARKYQFECLRAPLLKYFVHGKKIWTNPQALTQGLELMLRKYGYAAAFRKKCGTYYLNLGVQYCESNKFEAGRKALLRAARLNPSAPKPYAYLALALFGGETFRRARQAWARLLPRGSGRDLREGMAVNA